MRSQAHWRPEDQPTPGYSQMPVSVARRSVGCDNMNTVTLGIASHDAMTQSFAAAMRGEEQGQFISFDTVELLFQTLTETRWNLLRVMIGVGPCQSVRSRVGSIVT